MRRSKTNEERTARTQEDARLVRQSIKTGENFADAAQKLRQPYGQKKDEEIPSYDQLYDDLVESDCPLSAKYFRVCRAKEIDIFQKNLKMKRHIRDAHCLLLAIVENIKTAELTYRTTKDKELTLKLLVQTIHMVQIQDEAFHWLVREMYRIVLRITKDWEEDCTEILSRTHYEYGVVLTEKGDNLLEEAISQFEISLKVCKDTMWYTNDKDRNILHEDCCVAFCKTLLRLARIRSKTNPQSSAELAYRAVLTIEEVGISANYNLYCISKLRQSEYLIDSKDYEGAFKVLQGVQVHIFAFDSLRNKCEFYLWLGIAYFYLSSYPLALRKLNLSLALSEEHDYPDLKAHALLFMGKIHAQSSQTQAQARQCFIEAKMLFIRLSDFENEKLAKYLMAKLRAYQIFPSYIELMKKASCDSFCYFYDLLQWKQKMVPFWNDRTELHRYGDEYQCLLDEQVGKELLAKIQ